MAERFETIQILRGYLALCVMVGHSIDFVIEPTVAPWGIVRLFLLMVFNPWSAVAVFFVISGFVLAHSISKVPEFGLAEFAMFILRRFVRLAPVAWAGVALAIVYSLWQPNLTNEALTGFYRSQGGQQFSAALLPYYFTLTDLTYDQSLWSIVVELSAAFVIPPLALFKLRDKYHTVVHILIFGLLLALHVMLIGAGTLLFTYLFLFYAGIVAYSAHRRVSAFPTGLRFLFGLAGVMTTAVGAWYFLLYGTVPWRVTQYALMAIGSSMALSAVATLRVPRGIVRSLALRFGDMSYSFYAFHIIVLHALYTLTFDTLASDLRNGRLVFAAVGYGLAASLLTIPLAYLSRRTLEELSSAMRKSPVVHGTP